MLSKKGKIRLRTIHFKPVYSYSACCLRLCTSPKLAVGSSACLHVLCMHERTVRVRGATESCTCDAPTHRTAELLAGRYLKLSQQSMTFTAFCRVTPCSLVKRYQCFGGTCVGQCKTEAASSCQPLCSSTKLDIQEYRNIQNEK